MTVHKNPMNWEDYLSLFDTILEGEHTEGLYSDASYLEYTKMNKSRLNRWLKTGSITDELKATLKNIKEKQTWHIVTEHWCGDAAHNLPFLYMMTQENPFIELKLYLRDTPPLLIDDYLTNGGKSIPKLIIRNEQEEDLYVWGPRPADLQKIYEELRDKKAEFEEINLALQNWYNKDKGQSVQAEILELLK